MFYNSHYNIYPNGLNPNIYYFNPVGDTYLRGGIPRRFLVTSISWFLVTSVNRIEIYAILENNCIKLNIPWFNMEKILVKKKASMNTCLDKERKTQSPKNFFKIIKVQTN